MYISIIIFSRISIIVSSSISISSVTIIDPFPYMMIIMSSSISISSITIIDPFPYLITTPRQLPARSRARSSTARSCSPPLDTKMCFEIPFEKKELHHNHKQSSNNK